MRIILIIFIFVLIFSCRKTGSGFVRGTVYAKGTGLPLKGVKVFLFKSWHNGNKDFIGSDSTDSNGEYLMDIQKQSGYAYRVIAFNNTSISEYESLKYKKTAQDLSIYAEAYVEVIAKKNSSSSNKIKVSADKAFTGFSPEDNNPYEYYLDVKQNIHYYPAYSLVSRSSFIIKANTPEKISWSVYNGNTQIGPTYDTILTLGSDETRTLTINFN